MACPNRPTKLEMRVVDPCFGSVSKSSCASLSAFVAGLYLGVYIGPGEALALISRICRESFSWSSAVARGLLSFP